jgi:hypothetical protein
MTTQEVVVSQLVQVVVSRPRGRGLGKVPEKAGAELKPERVQLWLDANPGWRLEGSGTVLRRTRIFPGQGAALQFASFVSGLATSMALPAALEVRGGTVRVSLGSPRGRHRAPITENVLTLAGQIG